MHKVNRKLATRIQKSLQEIGIKVISEKWSFWMWIKFLDNEVFIGNGIGDTNFIVYKFIL